MRDFSLKKRRLNCFLMAVLLGVIASTSSYAQPQHEYWWVGVSGDDNVLVVIDTKSITETEPAKRRVWITYYYSPQDKELAGGNQVILAEFNCNSRQTRDLQSTDYNADAKSLSTSNRPSEWQYVVPRSIGEGSLNFTCGSPHVRKTIAISKINGTPDEWARKQFIQQEDARKNAAIWAALTPEEKLNRFEPDWRQICASKAFAQWLETAPKSDKDAAQRNGQQVINAMEAAIVIEHFKEAQKSNKHH